MIIDDKTRQPTLGELSEYAALPFFDAFLTAVQQEHEALVKIEYSGDRQLAGWNVKLRKGGRTLCTLYPRVGHFHVLLVVGRKEKERVEALLATLCTDFQAIYRETQEGMGQRWLLFDLTAASDLSDDIRKIVRIRRESK